MRAALLVLALLVGCGQGNDKRESVPTASATASAPLPEADAKLSFELRGKAVRSLTKRELTQRVTPERVQGYDPYYEGEKTFLALPIAEVLKVGFAGEKVDIASTHYVLRASDGYTLPMTGEQLVGDGAYLAVADVDVAGWAPVGSQKAHPGPYYLVWKGRPSLESHPRPWQLVGIEIARFEDVFPRTAPTGLPDDHPAQRGYATFRKRCIKCHAINQQGGQVGPELNIPQNITEYRPESQIRAYIRNPQTFRYSKMPAAPDLSEAQLDELIAYLQAMKDRKQDPKSAHE